MVFRGRPSAGCENCRRAKKRCGLEQPACQRCVKLKKTCSGYRDVSQLQFQDETADVKRKARRQQSSSPGIHADSMSAELRVNQLAQIAPPSDSSKSEDSPEQSLSDIDTFAASSITRDVAIPMRLGPKADDIALMSFLNNFASGQGHWQLLIDSRSKLQFHYGLDLAMKACGMAALNASHSDLDCREYARFTYSNALQQINSALHDPYQCHADETLITVVLLGYYENLACDSSNSLKAWKAHVLGASELLRIRGKSQYKTAMGRMLFREVRLQRITQCLWDDAEPPSYLADDQITLSQLEVEEAFCPMADKLVEIALDFCTFRSRLLRRQFSKEIAWEKACDLEARLARWPANAAAHSAIWQFSSCIVPESPQVWNGLIHNYVTGLIPSIMNTYRTLRIALSRTQEVLLQGLNVSDQQLADQIYHFQSVRKQMCDDICATIPVCLGHCNTLPGSRSLLMTAYHSVWPLFFATTCALERAGPSAIVAIDDGSLSSPKFSLLETETSSASWLQARWLFKQLENVKNDFSIQWTEGVMAILRGDFNTYEDLLLQEHESGDELLGRESESAPAQSAWIRDIEENHRGPRALIGNGPRKRAGPIWLGRIYTPGRRRVADTYMDRLARAMTTIDLE